MNGLAVVDSSKKRSYNGRKETFLFRQFDRRRSVFVQLLVSLFVVFFIATVVTGIVSSLTIRSAVADQTYAHNLETLRQTSRLIETVLDATERMAVRLSQNRTVQSVVLADWNRIVDHYPALRRVRGMIEDELASSSYIHSVYLVSMANDRMLSVSGILPLADLAETVHLSAARTELSSFQWIGPRAVRTIDNRTATVISLLVDVSVGTRENRGFLVVNLDERLFYDTVVSRNHNDVGTLAILNRDATVLSIADKSLLTDRVTLSELYPELGDTDEGYSTIADDSGRQFVSVITSPYNGWRYVSSTPYTRVMAASRRVLVLSIVVSLLFLSLGLGLSIVVSKRFYRPIKSLVSLVAVPTVLESRIAPERHVSREKSDEFELIYASVDTLLRENREYQERYAATDAILREHFLIDLVLGRANERGDVRKESKSFGVKLDARYSTVVVLRIAADAFGTYDHEAHLRDLRYRVYGIASSILNRHAEGFVVDFGKADLVIAVLTDVESPIDRCRLIANEAHDVISADLGIGTIYGIGTAQESYEGIPASYDQAMLAVEYARSSGSGSVVAVADVVADGQLHSVVLAHRRSIEDFVSAFRQQKYDIAAKRADQFVSTVLADRRLDKLHTTMLLHELLSAFLSLLISFDLDLNVVYGDDAHLFHDFALRKSTEETRSWFRDCVRTAAHHLAQRNSIRRRDFVGRMKTFVLHHFSEPVGLHEAAEHAHMNRQYFCSIFKTAFGTTFREYLAAFRAERAVELLAATSRPVGEIAAEVGFSSTRSFVRTFRAAKGLTPAKYRISIQMSSSEPD